MIMKYGRRYGRIYIILCFITEDRVERWSDEKGGGWRIFFELLRDIFCSSLSDNVIVLHYILHILMTSSLRKITLIDSCVMFGMKQRKFI